MLGVLPWPEGEASKAAATCLNAWLKQRGGIGVAEIAAGIKQVRAFFQANGTTIFESFGATEGQRIPGRAGYRHSKDGEDIFLVHVEVFRRGVCAGLDHQMIAKELIRLGLMIGQGRHQTQKLRNPAGRFYVVRAAILDGDSGDSGDTLESQGFGVSPVAESGAGDSGDITASVPPLTGGVPTENVGVLGEWGQREVSIGNTVPTVPTVPNEKGIAVQAPSCLSEMTH